MRFFFQRCDMAPQPIGNIVFAHVATRPLSSPQEVVASEGRRTEGGGEKSSARTGCNRPHSRGREWPHREIVNIGGILGPRSR